MKELKNYLARIFFSDIILNPLSKGKIGKLPYFISEMYRLTEAEMFAQTFILVEKLDESELSILQTSKHFQIIKDALKMKVVLLSKNLASYNRKRLVEKRINFIIPEKQLFLPDMWMEIKETSGKGKKVLNTDTLLPSAQLLVLFRILHRKQKIEDFSFKQLAAMFHYTPMVITNAVNNLIHHQICTIKKGIKEKYIVFNNTIPDMWNDLVQRNLLVSPVLKRVYTDSKPKNLQLLPSYTSALPEYSDVNPSRQEFYAVEKTAFYKFQKEKTKYETDDKDGQYCIELWKYNPGILIENSQKMTNAVDPLSLFLCFKENQDERIEDAMEKIIKKYIW